MSVNAATAAARGHLAAHQGEPTDARLKRVAALKRQGRYLHLVNSDAWFVDRVIAHYAAGRLPEGIFGQGAGDSADNPGDLDAAQCALLAELLDDSAALKDAVLELEDDLDDDELHGAVSLLGEVAMLARTAAAHGGLSVR